MEHDQKPYYTLFNAVTDAVAAMEAQNFGQVRQLLVQAQKDCEEWFLTRPEGGNEN